MKLIKLFDLLKGLLTDVVLYFLDLIKKVMKSIIIVFMFFVSCSAVSKFIVLQKKICFFFSYFLTL